VALLIYLQVGEEKRTKPIKKHVDKVKNYILDKTTKKSDPVTKKISSQNVELYFVKYIERKDQLALFKVDRTLSNSDTPLSDTIKRLLNGPSSSEESRKISSMFLANTKLRNARVSGGVAYLDFNSEVESGVGRSMLQARLYQIVYTATQFPNIQSVKILINGKSKNTFSSEGLSIRNPLTRLKTEAIF
jgi:spore germination protein GerM